MTGRPLPSNSRQLVRIAIAVALAVVAAAPLGAPLAAQQADGSDERSAPEFRAGQWGA